MVSIKTSRRSALCGAVRADLSANERVVRQRSRAATGVSRQPLNFPPRWPRDNYCRALTSVVRRARSAASHACHRPVGVLYERTRARDDNHPDRSLHVISLRPRHLTVGGPSRGNNDVVPSPLRLQAGGKT